MLEEDKDFEFVEEDFSKKKVSKNLAGAKKPYQKTNRP